MQKIKERKISEFLDRFSEILKENDENGKKKETALVYLSKNDFDQENLDDLFKAMENSLKQSNRLLTIQQTLSNQEDSPTDLPWLNDAQAELIMQQQGLLELMLQHHGEEIK